MYTSLGEAILTSNERLEIGVVLGPDSDWLPRLVPFLGHKNREYRTHILRALEGSLDGLETRFYVGRIGDELVSQVMVVGSRGAGLLGHVHTREAHRRKGACAALFRQLMPDLERAGFRVVCLGTGYDTPPYRIYHGFGFRAVAEDSGLMKWLATPEAEAELLCPTPATVREVEWGDWPWFELLTLQPVGTDEELPRSAALGIKAVGSAEWPFLAYQLRREQAPLPARALVSETGATVGWALLAPDPRWFGDAWVLDVHALPAFQDRLPELLRGLELPEAPVAAYTTEPEGPKAAALQARGLRQAAWLSGWLEHAGERHDLVVWTNA